MSDIKAVIQLLCQHLNILLKVNLQPELFRSAKFNNNNTETIQELWDTLVKLCIALGSNIPYSEKCDSKVWVKLRLASHGYNSAEFYSLPSDNKSGSRELLLALMWIIANENALANLTQECVRRSPLCQEYSDTPTEEALNRRSAVSILNGQSKKTLNLEDQINYCLWLANQIKYNINQIHDLEEERIKNTHKVHQATAGSSGLPHLSVFETKLVRDPELLNQWMPKLSKLNDLLTTHSKWLKKKSAFWEWMGTVVELKEKEQNSNSPQQGDESALADFIKAAHMYAGTRIADSESIVKGGFPRFFISSLYAKSTNNLVRKASSSDLLADMGLNDNAVIMHASDWLAQIDNELQDMEKMRHDKLQELNLLLQSMTQKLGIVAIADVSSGEVESEDCSK